MTLPSLDNPPGFLKCGLQGLAGTGKTQTAIDLAIALRAYFELDGEIAMFDTETGSAYVAPRVKQFGAPPLAGIMSRSLDKLLNFAKQCEKEKASVLIVDSVTHVWREACDSYLEEYNEKQRANRGRCRSRLEFQDWGPIKARFAKWTDFFLSSPVHIIVCGRLGYNYDFKDRDDGTGTDLIKTGTKMKAETEFGFEPSLLIEMSKERDGDGNLLHIATVEKDRTNTMMGKRVVFKSGKETPDSVFKAFLPHIERLHAGSHAAIDMDGKTHFGVDEMGRDEWGQERKQREIMSEEIKALFDQHIPGQAAVDKKRKAALLNEVFGTGSWTRISEETKSSILRAGLDTLRSKFAEEAPSQPQTEDAAANA